MNESTWKNAEVTPVYIKAGTFELDQRGRFRPAAFAIIELNGQTYLQTVGTEVNMLDGAQNDAAADVDLQSRIGFGFYREPMYVEDSALGDGGDDTILSVHKVSNI